MARKDAASLGQAVVYRVPDAHRTKTVKTNSDKSTTELTGSLLHPELAEFAGLVTRVHENGACDLVIFPPNRVPVSIDAVRAGDGEGEFRMVA